MAFGTYWETKATFLNRMEAFLNFESVYETLKTLNCHHLNESYTEQCFSTLLRPPQTRKQCCRHIVEEKCFFKCFPVCTFVMESFFVSEKQKNVSDFFQKYFVSAMFPRLCAKETMLTRFCCRLSST